MHRHTGWFNQFFAAYMPTDPTYWVLISTIRNTAEYNSSFSLLYFLCFKPILSLLKKCQEDKQKSYL